MKKTGAMGLLAGIMLVSIPVVYAEHSMSDTQHRKAMSGLHHPEHADDMKHSDGKATMSDAQHRKTMGGMHHPDREDEGMKDSHEEKKESTMSDSQHRKSMGGLHHPKD